MTRRSPPSPQKARTASRVAHDTRHTNANSQDFSRREIQHGTQRSETQSEGGPRRDDAGNLAPQSGRPEQESGDERRPYKRSGR